MPSQPARPAIRKAVIFLVIVLAATLGVIAFVRIDGPMPVTTSTSTTLRVGDEKFTLELAVNEEARTQGLMGRTNVAEHGGMVFAFPHPDVLRFWMGYCLTDMDIVYVDGTGRVTAMHTMKAEPPRGENEDDTAYRNRMPLYSSNSPAQFAIELKAGTAVRLGIRVGQKLDLDVARLKALAR